MYRAQRFLLSYLIAAGIAMAIPGQAWSQTFYDCSLLPGIWTGEHTDANGTYSRWLVHYGEDQVLYLEFYDAEGNLRSTQTGEWQCDGIREMDRFPGPEETVEFSYQIQQLDSREYVYKSDFDGTVFRSTRVEQLPE